MIRSVVCADVHYRRWTRPPPPRRRAERASQNVIAPMQSADAAQ